MKKTLLLAGYALCCFGALYADQDGDKDHDKDDGGHCMSDGHHGGHHGGWGHDGGHHGGGRHDGGHHDGGHHGGDHHGGGHKQHADEESPDTEKKLDA